jgi:energy-coupling factor transporter ATP-binding protein EcfA2
VVKSLASLVFYLRHQAQPGQLLIIDEPELNLHPDNHRRVARVLAKAVNRGLRVIISTHSDYIVRELSNLVVLGAAGARADAVVRELGYDREWLLRPEQINVLLFRGGGVERVPVSDAGFEVQTIEDEIRRLDGETQRILLGVE